MSTSARALRIAVISDVFEKQMGYAESALPKAFAETGADVHVITTRLPPYHDHPDFEKIYGGFVVRNDGASEEAFDGYTIHYLDYSKALGYVRIRGLFRKLAEIRPDVVQVFSPVSWTPLDAAIAKLWLGYKLFTGNHTTASVFPLALREVRWFDYELLKCRALRTFPGRVISWATEKCYAVTPDCADVARRFLGVPGRKIIMQPLGVDTDVFYPDTAGELRPERERVRAEVGCGDGEILCIYTGRFTDAKNPLLLAQAVERLRSRGEPFRAVFVGNGPQEAAIAQCEGSFVVPFVPYRELGRFFRAADIAVYPTQESMSMLDAAACGLPLVVNDTLKAVERIDGNGITYRLNDLDDLNSALLSLRDPELRRELGTCGAARMAAHFSWRALAGERLREYRTAVTG